MIQLRSAGFVFGLLAFFYAVGLAGHLYPPTLPWMLVLTPWFLAAAGAVLLAFVLKDQPLGPQVLWLVPVFVVTYLLEVLGVATGLVFGAYSYSEVLGTLVLGVPPVIGANWVLVVLGVYVLVRKVLPGVHPAYRILAVALGCVAFDFLLEPVAIHLGYWTWAEVAVPTQNYLAWGLIAAGAAWAAEGIPALVRHPILGWYVGLQAAFFLVLGSAGVRA